MSDKTKSPRILIVTDLEGISGIGSIEEMDREKKEYEQACEKLMLDINAVAEGAFKAGAGKVCASDGHGGGNNFIDEMLDRRVRKENRRLKDIPGDSYDAVAAIGAHAMAGTINGFLDHTQSSKSWFNYYVNGRKLGEIARWALTAGAQGIPVIMVSGDEAACAEARAFLGSIETAAVKQGRGRNRALLYPVKEARERISAAAEKAVRNYRDYKPFRMIMPLEIRLELYRSDMADDIMAHREDCERIDARTVRRITDNAADNLF